MVKSERSGEAKRSSRHARPVSVVAALREELQPLRRRLRGARVTRLPSGKVITGRLGTTPVVLMATGDGEACAQGGLSDLLDAFDVRAVIAIGVAGALSPDLEVGNLLVAERLINGDGEAPSPDSNLLEKAQKQSGARRGTVLSYSAIVTEPGDKDRIWRQNGEPALLVVDLESVTYARGATDKRLPFLVVKAVSDRSDESLPLDFNRFRRSNGSVDRGGVLRFALSHPSVMPELLRLRKRVHECAERLADLVDGVLAP